MMPAFPAWFRRWWDARRKSAAPSSPHLRRGREGEEIARRYLCRCGMVLLTRNYRTRRGEIDLVFRDGPGLVFVEVKTRSVGGWGRPADAVGARKRRRLARCALDYLRELEEPRVSIRFDVVEVVMDARVRGGVAEVRHLPNMFALPAPYRVG